MIIPLRRPRTSVPDVMMPQGPPGALRRFRCSRSLSDVRIYTAGCQTWSEQTSRCPPPPPLVLPHDAGTPAAGFIQT